MRPVALALTALTAVVFLYVAWSSARAPLAERGPRRAPPPRAAAPRPPAPPVSRRDPREGTPGAAARPVPDPVPGGAWAPGRLLAREELVDGATILGARSAFASMLYTIGFADAGAGEVEFVTRIPRPAGGRLAIVAARFDPPPSGLYQAGEGFYAVYHWSRRVEGVRISQEFDVELADAHGFGPEREGEEVPGPREAAAWLEPETWIESADEGVRALAAEIPGTSRREVILGVAEVVSRTLAADARSEARGAARAAATSPTPHPASSRQYCDLFVALCRAKGVPARFVEGFCDDAVGPRHYWVEVLLPRRGWRVVDPWLAAQGSAAIGATADLRLPLVFRTRDEALGGYHLCFLHASQDGQLAGWRDFKWRYVLRERP